MTTLTLTGQYNPYQTDNDFSMTPNWLNRRTEISFGAKTLYGRLRAYAGRNGKVFPSIATLATELGTSISSIQRYIDELKSNHLIETKRRGNQDTNQYFFRAHYWKFSPEKIILRMFQPKTRPDLKIEFAEKKNPVPEKTLPGPATNTDSKPGQEVSNESRVRDHIQEHGYSNDHRIAMDLNLSLQEVLDIMPKIVKAVSPVTELKVDPKPSKPASITKPKSEKLQGACTRLDGYNPGKAKFYPHTATRKALERGYSESNIVTALDALIPYFRDNKRCKPYAIFNSMLVKSKQAEAFAESVKESNRHKMERPTITISEVVEAMEAVPKVSQISLEEFEQGEFYRSRKNGGG